MLVERSPVREVTPLENGDDLDLRCTNPDCTLYVLKLEADEIDILVVEGPPLCPTCHQPLAPFEPDQTTQ